MSDSISRQGTHAGRFELHDENWVFSMQAMILAAGFGTRLRPYSLERPKPLFPVLGAPLLLHTLGQLQAHGATRVLVNAHHLREQISGLLAGRDGVAVQLEEKELGTGGGLRLARDYFGRTPFLAVNGDIVHGFDLEMVYQEHLISGAMVTMVLHDCPRFNNVRELGGLVTGFSGPATAGERLLAFTGVQVINPEALSLIPEGIFYNSIDCYAELIRRGGGIRALVVSGRFWTDMGTPDDYLRLHEDLLVRRVMPGFFPGRGEGPFFVAQGARLADGVSLAGWAAIGSGAVIGEGASLERVVLWDGAVVAPGTVAKDCIIRGGA